MSFTNEFFARLDKYFTDLENVTDQISLSPDNMDNEKISGNIFKLIIMTEYMQQIPAIVDMVNFIRLFRYENGDPICFPMPPITKKDKQFSMESDNLRQRWVNLRMKMAFGMVKYCSKHLKEFKECREVIYESAKNTPSEYMLRCSKILKELEEKLEFFTNNANDKTDSVKMDKDILDNWDKVN